MDIRSWELLEFSSVPVPADGAAITDGIRALHRSGRSVPTLEKLLRAQGFSVPQLVPANVTRLSKADLVRIAREV